MLCSVRMSDLRRELEVRRGAVDESERRWTVFYYVGELTPMLLRFEAAYVDVIAYHVATAVFGGRLIFRKSGFATLEEAKIFLEEKVIPVAVEHAKEAYAQMLKPLKVT